MLPHNPIPLCLCWHLLKWRAEIGSMLYTRRVLIILIVTTVCPGLLFFFYSSLLPPLCVTATSPAPCNSLELDYPPIPRLGQGALWTAPFLLPYLLHVSPSLLLYQLCVHQYLLIHDLCAPFVPASPHHYLICYCTIGARFLPLLHVYYHTPYTCLSSISTGQYSTLYCRLDFLSNQVAFPLLACECCLWISLLNHFAFPR